MTKSLEPFRFLLMAVSGWMNQQQLELIDYRAVFTDILDFAARVVVTPAQAPHRP
jgi:hypothetical protein